MLLVIPVSRSDANRIPDVVKALEVNPPGLGHELLVIAAKSGGDKARELEGQISRHFSKSSVFIVPTEPNAGWPVEMNFLFQQAAIQVSTSLAPNQGWMWYELDTVPLEEGWLTELEQEYYRDANDSVKEGRARNVFMGVKEPTIQSKNGEQMSQEEAGYHMAAVGIYPANIISLIPTIAAVAGGRHPFYQRIQWYVVKSLKDTPLIQNNWRTEKYRVTKEGIKCDSAANWAFDVHFNAPIGKDVLLVHGCKDSSLANIVASRNAKSAQNAGPFECSVPVPFIEIPPPSDTSKGNDTFLITSQEPAKETTLSCSPITPTDIQENYAAGEVKPEKPKRKKLTTAERRKKNREYIRAYRARVKAEAEAKQLQPEQ